MMSDCPRCWDTPCRCAPVHLTPHEAEKQAKQTQDLEHRVAELERLVRLLMDSHPRLKGAQAQ